MYPSMYIDVTYTYMNTHVCLGIDVHVYNMCVYTDNCLHTSVGVVHMVTKAATTISTWSFVLSPYRQCSPKAEMLP